MTTNVQLSTKTAPLKFKFRNRGVDGQLEGFFVASKGEVNDEGIVFRKERIAAARLLGADSRGDYVVLRFQTRGAVTDRVFRVFKEGPVAVVGAINRLVAMNVIAKRIADSASRGLAKPLAIRPCPCCATPLDLTDFAVSPVTYCPWCRTLFESEALHGAPEPKIWRGMGLCDRCGLYATPRQFTVFYFWFVVVAYGFSYRKSCMCHTCMRGEAWKMLAANLIFILGVPTALTQLIRAYFMGSAFNAEFKGLDTANGLTQKNYPDKARAAVEIYREIEARARCSPGVLYNHALALKIACQYKASADKLEQCLRECSNYFPAFVQLIEVYRLTKEPEKAEALVSAWSPQEQEFARDAHAAG